MLSIKERLLIPIVYLLSLLPQRSCRRFVFNRVHWLANNTSLLNKVIETSKKNIRHCLPNMAEKDVEQLAKTSIAYTAQHYISFPALWIKPTKWAAEQFIEVQGVEKLQAAQQSGFGVIVLFLHYGSWEAQCIHLTDTFYDKSVTILVKDKMQYGSLVNHMRVASRPKGIIEPANASGVRLVFKSLLKKGVVTFSPDHVPGNEKGAISALFFNQPAQTMTLLHQLLQKVSAKVFIGVSDLGTYNSEGYRVRYIEVDNDVYANDELTSVTALNRSIERVIAENPQEYTWWYKRFGRL